MEETKLTERIEGTDVDIPVITPVATLETPTEVVPLNCQTALVSFSEEERQEIIALADSIDVTEIDKVMNYGSVAMKMTFDQCGEFLKKEKGSQADQEVIADVIELSKKASESYEDFNLVLKEPSFFQKLFLKMFSFGKDTRAEKIRNCAITNYQLLAELKVSYESWIEMLKEAMGEIEEAAISDFEATALLEKYIIAGNIAQERIQKELEEIDAQHKQTGLQQYSRSYEELKEGADIFAVVLSNLEKSRVMYHLSRGQLALIRRSNRNIQVSIHTQKENTMALINQQIRNAVLDKKNEQVVEGHKAISRLSDELIKEISKKVGTTAEETERMIYSGFYNVEAAKEAVSTVIKSCEAIRHTASEMIPKMKADMEQLTSLIQELEPSVTSVETFKIEEKTVSPTGDAKLKF